METGGGVSRFPGPFGPFVASEAEIQKHCSWSAATVQVVADARLGPPCLRCQHEACQSNELSINVQKRCYACGLCGKSQHFRPSYGIEALIQEQSWFCVDLDGPFWKKKRIVGFVAEVNIYDVCFYLSRHAQSAIYTRSGFFMRATYAPNKGPALEETARLLPDLVAASFLRAQEAWLEGLDWWAQAMVASYTASAAALAAVPVPFASRALCVPVQVAMVLSIAGVYRVAMSRKAAVHLCSSIAGGAQCSQGKFQSSRWPNAPRSNLVHRMGQPWLKTVEDTSSHNQPRHRHQHSRVYGPGLSQASARLQRARRRRGSGGPWRNHGSARLGGHAAPARCAVQSAAKPGGGRERAG